jgi:HK97 family phage major capsid protein
MNARVIPPLTFEETVRAATYSALKLPYEGPKPKWSSAAGANESIPSEGGFLFSGDTSTDLLTDVEDESPLYAGTFRLPVSKGNFIKFPAWDDPTGSSRGFAGLTLYWPDEATAVSASIPKLRSIDVYLNKLMGTMWSTVELRDDFPALVALLRYAWRIAAARAVDSGIVAGPGAGQMLGILNSPALVVVSPESGQSALSLRTENVTKIFSRMTPRGQSNFIWLVNPDLLPQVLSLGAGYITFNEGLRLLGRPLISHESCSAVGSVGDIIAVDASQYVIGQKPAELAESLAIKFIESEAAYRFTWRIAGSPAHARTTTLANASTVVSPYVTLGAR